MTYRENRKWIGETVAEKSADMIDSYTRRSVSHSDTVVVIDPPAKTHHYCYQKKYDHGMVGPITCYSYCSNTMAVAQISDCGYVDFFRGSVGKYTDDNWSAHFVLYPDEMETLFNAYAEWKDLQRVKNERKEISRIEFGDFFFPARFASQV